MSCNSNDSLVRHLYRFIGEPVTIFTTSGGASGCGFTGILLAVNNRFVRLLTSMGSAPASPVPNNLCNGTGNGCLPGFNSFGISDTVSLISHNPTNGSGSKLGSICDIPIDRIAAFCHNNV